MLQLRAKESAEQGVGIQIRLGGDGIHRCTIGAGNGSGQQEPGTENEQVVGRKGFHLRGHPVPENLSGGALPTQIEIGPPWIAFDPLDTPSDRSISKLYPVSAYLIFVPLPGYLNLRRLYLLFDPV